MSKNKETLDASYIRLGIPQDSSNKEINEVFTEKKAALLATLGQVHGTREQTDVLAQVTEVNNAYKVIDTSMGGALSAEAKQQEQVHTEVAKPQVKATKPQVEAAKPPVDINQDHYVTLGLKPGESLTREQAQAEYTKAQSKPGEEAKSRIKAINVLASPERKAAYDTAISNAAKSAEKKIRFPVFNKVQSLIQNVVGNRAAGPDSSPKVNGGGPVKSRQQ